MQCGPELLGGFLDFRLRHTAVLPGGLDLDRVHGQHAVLVSQREKVAALSFVGQSEPKACELCIDRYDQGPRMTRPVVARSDEHAREPPDARDVRLGVGLEEIDEAITEQGDTFFEKVLKCGQGKAEIEAIQRKPEQEGQALVAGVVAHSPASPLVALENAGGLDATGRRKRAVGKEEPECGRRRVPQGGIDVLCHEFRVGGGLRRLTGVRASDLPDHVVERAEHRILCSREEFHLAVDPLEHDVPSDREGAHR